MRYRHMFCHKLGSKRRFGLLGAKEASGRKVAFDDLLALLNALDGFDEQFSNVFAVFHADVDGLALVDASFSFDVVEVVLLDGLNAIQV